MDLIEKVTIRHMVAADLPDLEWGGEYVHFRRQFETTYRDYLNGSALPWVAVSAVSGEMLGQVFVLFSSRHRRELADGNRRAYLFSVRVKPAFRGRGLGTQLMDVVEVDLSARGFEIATLNVARDNPAAYRFYYRRQYRVTAPEPGQWSYIDHRGVRRFVDEPAWRMEKQLPAAG